MTNYFNCKKIIIIVVIFLLQLGAVVSAAVKPDAEIDSVLSSAESIFKSMNHKDYSGIWQLLSGKSKNTIVDDVYKSIGSDKSGFSREMIDNDFTAGGKLSQAYWKAYLDNFDPDTILEQSKWEMGPIKKNAAEIKITFKKAAAPAILQMFKEDGKWKVGLVETFGTKK